MQLYHAPASPFVRKVMIVLQEAGRADAVTLIAASGTPVDPGSIPLDRNPLGKIPALVREDGGALYDSRVICRYLDDLFDLGLYPGGARLWPVLTLEATADGIADAAVLMRYESVVRPAEFRYPDWMAGQSAKIDRALDAVEARWLSHLAGPVDMSQIALAAALGYLDFRQPERTWRDGRPGLAQWFAGFAERPSMQATAAG
ncbi:MAG: glutathione S-transferase [Tabrizicola sp.]|nr:glutathione S-transferase [Tabrizicola sp.]